MSMPEQKRYRSKQDYATPPQFLIAVMKLLNITSFSHDYAADINNRKAGTFWDEEKDSLKQPNRDWRLMAGSGWGWLNPPYNNIGPWAEKCYYLSKHGGKVALLVPASVGSNWYRDYVHQKAGVFFLNGRIPFMPDKPTWLYPKDCLLALYDSAHERSAPGIWSWRTGERS
jgi:hypothetical protein